MTLHDASGIKTISVDRLLCATGYKPNLTSLTFIDDALRRSIRTHHNTLPALNDVFETSVPNLYIVGALADHDFGPLVGFMNMCGVSARILARHFAHKSTR
jgi:thioredoxin reductase